jgi:hypothetical protein
MAVLGDGCDSCTGTCQASSGDGNHFVFVNAEEFVDMEVEVVPKPITSAVIQPEPANCVDLLRNYPGSHSETCLTSSDGENQVIGVKVEEVADTEEEWDPQPSTSGTITTESKGTVSEHNEISFAAIILHIFCNAPVQKPNHFYVGLMMAHCQG